MSLKLFIEDMKIGYYFLATYHRKHLDKLLKKNFHLYRGTVLDIGGRDRGIFRSPKNSVQKWITADIEPSRKPDIILDVAHMDAIADKSIDVISALELFEHVREIDSGINECWRILKYGGSIIISAPFLYRLHADPSDYQRWTKDKWEEELKRRGFQIKELAVMGVFFTVWSDMAKTFLNSLPFGLKYLGFVFHPLLDFVVALDSLKPVKGHKILGSYHGGYFIIARKIAHE